MTDQEYEIGVGHTVTSLREQAFYSQEYVAEKIQMRIEDYRKLEAGDFGEVMMSMFYKIALLYRVSIRNIFK